MPCNHGKTCEEAIRNGKEVVEMYLEAWQTEGEAIPKPKMSRLLEAIAVFLGRMGQHCQTVQ